MSGDALAPRRHATGPPEPLGAATSVVWTVWTSEEQDHQLALLHRVGRLAPRPLAPRPRTVPPCWAQHGALIEELAALHLARQVAYAKLATGCRFVRWHEHLNLVRAQLCATVARSGCRVGAHRGA